MKLLILGGDGMLGHQLLLSLQSRHTVKVTLRQDAKAYQAFHLFNEDNAYFGVDVRQDYHLINILSAFQPEAVINAVGIIKHRKSVSDIFSTIEINTLFPHYLAKLCSLAKTRMIHISTDCVFSGNKGNYLEDDFSDAVDLYGRSKYLGEVRDHHLTLRTSIIGLELARKDSLIEWFLSQKEKVKGFRKAIYSGMTTLAMSRLIEYILVNQPMISGLWHVASASPINKYDLLCKLSSKLGRHHLQIEPDDHFICDRSLNANLFFKRTEYRVPTWDEMLNELAEQIMRRESFRKGIECNA